MGSFVALSACSMIWKPMKSTRQIDFVINADDVESMSRLAQIKEWKPDFDGARFEYLLEFDAKILHPIVRQEILSL